MSFLFKIIRWKQTSIINQSLTCKHKINESNAEVSTCYWIVCFYSKYVCFYIFMPNNFFNFLSNMFDSKTVKIIISIFFYIQSNLMCTNICIFIKIYYMCPNFYSFREIISRISSFKSKFRLKIFLYFKGLLKDGVKSKKF